MEAMPSGGETAARCRVATSAMRLRLPVALPASTKELEPLREVVGQSRAQEAIRFGLAIDADGYNIAISGHGASGRSTIAADLIADVASASPAARDWCYLYNFADPRRPKAVSVPPGGSAELEKGLAQLSRVCSEELPRAFDSETYSKNVQETIAPFSSQREEALHGLERKVREMGFLLNPTPIGLVPVPCEPDGSPMVQERFDALPEAERERLSAQSTTAQELIGTTMRQVRHIEAQANEKVAAVDAEITRFVLSPVFEDLRRQFGNDGLEEHFTAIETDIVNNLAVFKRFTEGFAESAPPQVVAEFVGIREQLLKRYHVNVFVRHGGKTAGAPVQTERHPSFANLFGRIEFETRMGMMSSDFMHIRPGALHLANGGFLILNVEDVLTEPRSWQSLKRALKTHEVRVGDGGETWLPFPVVDIAPEGIPLQVKVVLIGEPQTFALLDMLDSDFGELFKIRAEFEPDTDATAESIIAYAKFVRRTQSDLGLRHFSGAALEEVVQFGSRLAQRTDRLSTRFGLISDLCVEANHVAQSQGSAEIDDSHVLAAIAGKRNRSELLSTRLRRLIAEGTLHVETTGTRAGQVNGLAVFQMGTYAFGTPLRISCQVSPGRQGVVAIERETERSGAIHTKGVLVLSGYLSGTFGRSRPMTFSASLTFEQSYDEVEGDSASSAELYAILTALADVPVRQSIAVTGSLDQFGNVQAVGGVTEKVEGFYDLCATVGLTGEQGVIVPASNVRSLTLRPDVIEAVEKGRFSIWAISRVEEGIEILTGLPAGAPDAQGLFPHGTVFARVVSSLAEMHKVAALPGTPDQR